MSVWNLITADKFNEACIQADREYALSGDLFPLRNKIIALLELGKMSDAEELAREICSLRKGETSFDSIFLGVAQWTQGKRIEAIGAWQQATQAKYLDAAGGVDAWLLLLYAATTEKLDYIKEQSIKALNKFYQQTVWPAPLAAYALGKIDKNSIKRQISDISALRYKQLAQAEFYFGVFSDGAERIQHYWRSAWDYVPESYIVPEHHLSLHEFNSLQKLKN